MKLTIFKKLLVLPLVFIAGSVISQPPPAMNFSAVAKDPQGNPAKNRTVYVKDIIYQTAPAPQGNKVWEESHIVTTNDDGIYKIIIGKGTKAPAILINDLNGIDWANGPYFFNLQVAVAPSIPATWWVAADNYIDMGTEQWLSVPYALFSGNASITNVTTNITPGPKNTFLITDSLGNVNWQYPQSASVNVTQISNNTLVLANNIIASGQNAIIAGNTTTKITMTVPGAEVGNPVIITPLGDYVNFNIYSAWVSNKDEVSIRFSNFQKAPQTVAGNLYKVVIVK